MASTSESKRRRALPTGGEAVWKWYTFGNNVIQTATGESVYLDVYDLPGAGHKQGGKLVMLECARAELMIEPWAANPVTLPVTAYSRWTLQANGKATLLWDAGNRFLLHKLLERPDVYAVCSNLRQIFTGAEPMFHETQPVYKFDFIAPDGSGLLLKGNKIWASYCYISTHEPFGAGPISYAWRCLCRHVLVDPVYYWKTAEEAANCGSDD